MLRIRLARGPMKSRHLGVYCRSRERRGRLRNLGKEGLSVSNSARNGLKVKGERGGFYALPRGSGSWRVGTFLILQYTSVGQLARTPRYRVLPTATSGNDVHHTVSDVTM